ncbi:MAG: SsrA-binding protein [Omnitrophica WOR_2 bacterium RIFCSPLOWO2_01_FULL_41_12]|nr:MAG: SsrA-binding protein [Omnitrophica WOR_2 bacterium RIFCSPLOWO2_01_FULL_41_12]
MKIVAANRKAQRDYNILETIECGIELKGSEVKSVRDGNINLNDSFARLEHSEVMLYNTHISPYAQASYLNVEPTRPRKLLLHRKQINKLMGAVAQRGFTLIPLKAFFSGRGFLKIELALCKGKKFYDKREDIKRREETLAMRRILKARRK